MALSIKVLETSCKLIDLGFDANDVATTTNFRDKRFTILALN